jgi:type I restriction enzyme S subunit
MPTTTTGFKQTEVGPIPEDWEVAAIGDVLKSGELGGNYANQDTATSYPLMKMGNLDRGKFNLDKVEFVPSSSPPDPTHRLDTGDLLFNTRNTPELVGKVALWRDELPEAYYNSNLMRLVFVSDRVASNEFANYALNADYLLKQLRNLVTATTSVAAIYRRDLLNILLALPPLAEQRAIADALADVDALLDRLDALVAKKRAVKIATMQRLLTGRQRLPGFSGAWETRRLGDVAEMSSGGTPLSSVSSYYNGSIPWASVSDLSGSEKYLKDTERHLTQEGLDNSTAKLFPSGSLLYAMYASIGEVSITSMETASSQAILGIQTGEKLNSEFLYYTLHSRKDVIANMGQQGTQSNLNASMVKSFSISLPNLNEQEAIAAVLSAMDAEIEAVRARRAKTQAVKRGMMQELLTGRTRLV